MISKNQHIILGDIHLGRSLNIGKPGSGAQLNSRVGDQLQLLDWVLKVAVEYNVRSIITTGDVYEFPRPHPSLIRFFMQWLKKCERAGVDVHILAGNHDIIRTGSMTASALDIVPAVELPHAKVYKDFQHVCYDDFSFAVMPYRDRRMYNADDLQSAASELQKEFTTINDGQSSVLIGHLALEGSIYVGDEIDDFSNEIFCPLDMFDNFTHVWMGHIHKPQVMCEKPYLAHVGSMDKSDFSKSEMDHDKVIVLFDAENNYFENITIPTRPLHEIKISVPEGKDTTDFVINNIYSFDKEKSLKQSIVRLDISLVGQDIPNVERNKVQSFLYDKLDIHYLCKIVESRQLSSIPIDSEQKVFDDDDMSIALATENYFNIISDLANDIKIEAKTFALERIDEYKLKYESSEN